MLCTVCLAIALNFSWFLRICDKYEILWEYSEKRMQHKTQYEYDNFRRGSSSIILQPWWRLEKGDKIEFEQDATLHFGAPARSWTRLIVILATRIPDLLFFSSQKPSVHAPKSWQEEKWSWKVGLYPCSTKTQDLRLKLGVFCLLLLSCTSGATQ